MEISPLQKSLAKEQCNAAKGLLVKVYAKVKTETADYGLQKHDAMISANDQCPKTVHPNLWEHAKLNMEYGLYRVNRIEAPKSRNEDSRYDVKPGDIFQIRGNDLANMTLVYDGSGWIVMDVLTTSEVAYAVWTEIVQKYLNAKPVTAVIYSHTHVDHYGGVSGLSQFFDKGKCKIYAPEGFKEHAVSENIYVGTAMSRRGMYQYGTNLDVGVTGHVDCGLGTRLSMGTNSIIEPDIYVSGTKNTKVKIGKIELEFQYTPGTEAPVEMNVYIKNSNVLFIAENCCGTLHNTLTPRGAQVRDPLAWANYLDQTLTRFPSVETICSSHNWPRFGKQECKRYLELQMDMYRFINNATLHLVNLGYTIHEVGRILEDNAPRTITLDWCCRGFYGTYNHNAKAVYQKYIGWYDGNPAHLNPLLPTDRANKYVNAFGAENILKAADKAAADADSIAWAVELYDYLLNADTGVDKVLERAKKGYANALRKLGYESEAATWRNMYLTAAQEVEHDFSIPESSQRYLHFAAETIQAMSLDMILQFMSIMLKFNQPYADPKLLLAVNIEEENAKAYAVVWHRNNILHYRIITEEGDMKNYNGVAEYTVKCTKLDFFKAFIELDIDLLKKMNIQRSSANVIEPSVFFPNKFTRFALDFPIVTRRDAF